MEAVSLPGEELDPQRPSVTESGGSAFLPSWVFFDSGESMKNYPIGEDQGFSDLAPVLGSSGAGGDLESMGRGHVHEDYGVGLYLGLRVRQRLHLL